MPERLDFRAIAEAVDIFEVAQYANLKVIKNRATCPACESERALEFYPETNTFYCHNAKVGSDCISLLAHVKGYQGQYRAAKEIQERFLQSAPQEKPKPLKEEKKPFDPDTFAAKHKYDGEIEGLTEDKAKLYRIGVQRGKLYLPICPPDVKPAAFAQIVDGKVKLPDEWLPEASNIEPIRKRPA